MLIKKIKKIALRDYLTEHPRIYLRFGVLWMLRYRNYIDRKLILGERYEDAQLKHCSHIIKKEGVTCFIDAGANFGLYSITLAAENESLQSVIAFEPDRRNFNQLSANIYLNNLDAQIDARRMGLSNEAGVVSFFINKGNSTGKSRVAETAPAGTKADDFDEIAIEVDCLDSQLESIRDENIYIKIDVEGHEKLVVSGGKSFFERNRCFLQMEILAEQEKMIRWMSEEMGFVFLQSIQNDYFFKTAE